MYRTKKPAWINGTASAAAPLDEEVMPVAIIGMSGRFPGDAENPQKLWDMLSNGRSGLCDIPSDRFNIDAYYHPHNERQGTMNVRKAHLMERDISAFDAPFFTMPVAEAQAMDPQQRMALECTYEALENAGIRMEDVSGSQTSCFVGCFTRDYSDMMSCDPEDLPLYQGTGTGSTLMSNRVSWFFNMKGPSISLDTACSSSMAALHLGCQSLRTGETTMSVVGGTNLILMPDIMGAMTRLHFLSPDGKCQSFDHKANGYSRGEGAGFCVIKPLHLAIQDGDVIRGVIRNTGVNQDGNTPGITLPSAEAQESLIRQVYSEAGLSLANTAYVEAHGTGTPAGDPVEAAALSKTFGKARVSGDKLYMGSVKSNIGHLEGGSGLAQVVKGVLMLEKGEIPPSLWFEKPNPQIPMEDWNLAVPTETMQWPTEGLRRISINSFGYGGTNAHCIIDDAYHYMKTRRIVGNHNVQCIDSPSTLSTPDSGVDVVNRQPENIMWSSLSSYLVDSPLADKVPLMPKLLLWTSNEQAGVDRTAKIYASYLADKIATGLTDGDEKTLFTKFARTLAARRSILPWRSFLVASSCKEAISQLEAPPASSIRSSNYAADPKVAFVFTGQGAQWFAMGRELFAHPVFRESLEAAGRYFVSVGSPWSLITEMFRDEQLSRIESPDIAQPSCTALQVALVDLLWRWGVKPTAVTGHSSGEIAAAYAKGAIAREDAWKISYHRGHLSSCIRGFAPTLHGSMLAVGLGPEALEPYIAGLSDGDATIACINSPTSTTLSGDAGAIEELERTLKDDGHFVRKLRIGVAYHSPHMQVIAEKYRQAVGHITTLPEGTDHVNMFSSLTGENVDSNGELGIDYWVANIVSPVKFSNAMQSLLNFSESSSKRRRKTAYVEHLIEIGPHGALKGPIKQILGHDSVEASAADVTYQSVLERGKNSCETALAVAGRLFQYGYPIAGEAILNNDPGAPVEKGFLVDMPPFAWNHSLKYWSEPWAGKDHRFRKHHRKDLCGAETTDSVSTEPRFRNILRSSEVPWMQFHKVQGSTLYPAAGMMVMAIEVMCQRADQTLPIAGYELRDVIISKALVIPQDDSGIETMLTVKPFRQGTQSLAAAWQEFQLHSRKEAWELNCTGLIRIEYNTANNPNFADEDVLAAQKYAEQYTKIHDDCSRAQNPRHFYDHLGSIGLYYGGVFQTLTEIRKGEYRSACRLKVPDTKSSMPHQFEFPHVIHPTTLDSIVQMALPATCSADEELTVPMVPVSVGRLYVSADTPSTPGDILSGYATSEITGLDGESTIVVSDEQWRKPLVIFENLKAKNLSIQAAGNGIDDLNLRKMGTYFHWQQDLSLLNRKNILDLCANALGDMNLVGREIIVELEMACIIIIKRVLQECSAEEADKFAWNFKLFYDYMQHYYNLCMAGDLHYQVEKPETDWLNMSPEAEEELLARVSGSSTDGRALVEHGKHLPQILRSEISPLQILMADDLLHDFYETGVGTAQDYAQMCWYADQMAHKTPSMKILEVGAGTAGATLPILTKLGGAGGTAPRFSNYTFTDISVGYFEKARTKLAPWQPFMNFAKLNIEEDPIVQGFEEGGYDLVVASNVIHATRSIDKSLQHIRKLLKPTGKLVISEVTPFGKMRFHMVVGSLEGWWYGEEDGRHLGPTLEIDEWNDALIKAGFDGLEVDFQDFPNPNDRGLSVMVAGASAPDHLPAPKEVIIVLPPAPEPDVVEAADMMTHQLQERGSDALTVSLQDTAAIDLKDRSCLCLVDANQGSGFLLNITDAEWDLLKRLVFSTRDMTYVTRGGTVHSENPSANLMSGMARSIRSENYDLPFTTLDAEHGAPLDKPETVTAMLKVFISTSNSKDAERPDWEYAIRDSIPMVQRVLLEKGTNDMTRTWHTAPKPEQASFKQEGRPLTLGIGTPGRLDTLRFEDQKVSEPLGADEVEICVKAAGLNFKDIMIAMGQLSQSPLGVECAGIVSRVGSRVTDLDPGAVVMTWKRGTFRNFTRAPAAMVQRVPDGMDLTTAASIPVVYSTAQYSLSTIANLQPGETLLVHGASGGVGQAAIILAQYIGATVFATVSSETKKALITDTYGIPESHVFNSRDPSAFAQGVLRLTNGRGVDVVLNSLAGEALRMSWLSIARFGRFIELGQRDIVGNMGLDMEPFLRNVSFHSVNMLDMLDWNLDAAARTLAEVVDLLRCGVVKPVTPVRVMPFSRMEEAFRLLQTGQNMGKVVLETHDDDVVPVLPATAKHVHLREDATYVISGGGGGLGRAIASWMVKRGARNVLLLSRSGSQKEATRDLVARLSKQGARVEAWACDVGDEKQLLDALNRCRVESWPTIRGAVQGAMVLKDAIYENMTRDQFRGAIVPKVHGSWNLHKHLPKDMDFYVLLSSSAGIAGSPGQCNYSAGNAFQDALAHYRRSKGLAACSIDTGIVLGVGFLAEDTTDTRVHDNIRSWRFLGSREPEFMGILGAAIRGECLAGDPMPPQLIMGLGTGGMLRQGNEKYPWWLNDAKFAHIAQVDMHRTVQDDGGEDGTPLSAQLGEAGSMDQAADIVSGALVRKLAKSIIVSAEDIEVSKPISSYGVDSLLAVELRSWIQTQIKAEVSTFDLLGGSSITSLSSKLAAASSAIPQSILE